MILYEYKCSECREITESFERTIEEARRVIECPKCKGDALRILSTVSFKVNGYSYENGYSKPSATKQ